MECQCPFFKTGKSTWRGNKNKFVICIYLYIYVPLFLSMLPNISPPKRPFEKCIPIITPHPEYKPSNKAMDLFSGFYDISFLRGLYQIGQNLRNSQKLVHENVYTIKLKMRHFSVDSIVSMLVLYDVISITNLCFRNAGKLMNTYRL